MDALLRKPETPRVPAAVGAPAASRAERVVWERAADLAVEVFLASSGREDIEPALRDPLRAAALAVPTALARAHGRGGREGRAQMITALGAIAEVDSHLAVAGRLGGGSLEEIARLRGMVEILRRLVVALGTRQLPSAPPAADVPPTRPSP